MKRSLLSKLIVIGSTLFAVIGSPAYAAEINVACSAAALITAIDTANGTPEADTLNLAPVCVYSFTAGDTTNNDSALPRITTPITINGSASFLIRVSGSPEFRLLYVDTVGNLELNNVVVLGGQTPIGFGGGGIENQGTLTVNNSIISGNTASIGGGVFNNGALNVNNSTLTGNYGNIQGGAINSDVNLTMTVTDSVISGNSAPNGGGIVSTSGNLQIEGSAITGNSAASEGGGLWFSGNTMEVRNSTISGNSANNGGGIYVGGVFVMMNSVISGNRASNSGGGIHQVDDNIEIYNSTITGNASTIGGGIHVDGGTAALINDIVWGNSSSTSVSLGTLLITHSDVQGGFAGTGNLNVDPLFVDPRPHGIAPTTAGNYHLQLTSPVIDKGNNAVVSLPQDIDGDTRIFPLIVDMGADEVDYCPLYASPYTVAAGDTAALSVAIDCANTNPDANVIDLTPSFYIFTVGNSVNDDSALPRITTPVTINGNGATLLRGGGPAFRLLYIDASGALTLNNTTVAGGIAVGGAGIANGGALTMSGSIISGNHAAGSGGGVVNVGTMTVTNSTITGNSASFDGGGILNISTLTLTNSTLSNNSASFGGGIINDPGATAVITSSTVSGNSSSSDGGGIHNTGNLTVTNSTFSSNSSGNVGGGITNIIGMATVTGSTISGNSADWGGGIYTETVLNLLNSTVAANNAPINGGGVSNPSGTVTITNSIVWGNNTQIGTGIGPTVVTYSAIEGGFTGTGNIALDPLFVSPVPFASAPTAAGDYRLQANSPALNAGSNAALPADTLDLDGDSNTAEPIPYDRDGNARVVNGTVDMGAYEHQTVLAQELLANGDFETNVDGTPKLPDGWTLKNGSGDKLNCKPGKPYAGLCAFAFKGGAGEKAALSQTVDLTGVTLEAGDTLVLSNLSKAMHDTAKALLQLSVTYNGNPNPDVIKLKVKKNTSYTQVMLPEYAITGDVTAIKVTFKHKSTAGTMLIDDVSLIHTPGGARTRTGAPLPPPAAPNGFRGGN